MKILHIVSHPHIKDSRINKAWLELFAASAKVNTSYELYSKYNDWNIDVAQEQQALVTHDKIILQFPIMWYATPPLLKKWCDDVLAYGFAYGKGGDKLKGKDLQLILSTGGQADAYTKSGANNFTIAEFLRPLEQTAAFCGMNFLKPLVMHDAFGVSPEQVKAFGEDCLTKI